MKRAPGRPRSAEADRAIRDATVDLLIERGIDGTSIEQVAQRAGVTRATIYRRYRDKTEMLIAALNGGHDIPGDLPECRDVEELLGFWAQALADPRGRRLLRRLMPSLREHPELMEAYTRASIEPRHEWIRAVLERARDEGRFPPDTDLEIIHQILTGAVSTHLVLYPDTSTAQDIHQHLLAVLRHTTYRSQT